MKHGISPENITIGIACVLKYAKLYNDSELHQTLNKEGVIETLVTHAGLDKDNSQEAQLIQKVNHVFNSFSH